MKNTNYILKKVPLLSFFGILSFSGYSQTFTEGIGSVSGTVQIATHEGNNGFDNDALSMSGTADLRSTGPSNGYVGASMGMHVYFNTNQIKTFQISGIDGTGLGCFDLSFGIYKSTTTANGSGFKVKYSTDGVNFINLNYAALPTGSGTNSWTYRTITGIPATNSLTIRFETTATPGLSYKLDDIKLTSIPAEAGTISITDTEVCSGGSAIVTGNTVANTTYQWQESSDNSFWSNVASATDGTTLDVNPVSTMYYRREDKGICGIAYTNVVQLTVIADPIIQFNASNVSCFGSNDGFISSSITGGTNQNSYNYNWTPEYPVGDGTSSISELSAGLYMLNIIGDLGCDATDTISISQPLEFIASSVCNQIACFGDSTTVSVHASGGCVQYTGTGEFLVGAGTHTYLVTDANGCTSSTTIIVSEPEELILTKGSQDYNGYGVSCFGDSNGVASISVVGGTPEYNFLWNNGAESSSISNLSAGVYFCTVTDSNGCSVSDSITLLEPSQVTIYANNLDAVNCFGDSTEVIIISSGGALEYTVNDDGIYNVPAGSYTYNVVDANGCSDSVSILISQPSELTINAGSDGTVFFGYGPMSCQTIDASAEGGTPEYSFSWSSLNSGSGNGSYIVACPTTNEVYTVSVMDSSGCIATDEVSICVVDVQCDAGESKNTKVEMCQIPPGNPENGHTICIDESAVSAHLAMGCQLGACGELETACFDAAKSTASSEIGFNKVALSVFPNPSEDKVTVSLTLSHGADYSIVMYDMLGNTVLNIYNGPFGDFENQTFEVNTSSLKKGIYFVTVSDGHQKIESMKVIKQ